jgi:6-pyruvoyltetrahydropterin/6-carboxytetrahydropterin synthase
MLTITKRLEFDAGHRIPDHNSKCRNIHGHRYALEITLIGTPIKLPGSSNNGMLMDFSDVKSIAMSSLIDIWDHAFLVFQDDTKVIELLSEISDHKTVVLDRIPTVENMVAIAFEILQPLYVQRFGNDLKLTKLRLYETPTCWADFTDQ